MGIEREFQSYGAQLVNRAWAVSAVTADPRSVFPAHLLQTRADPVLAERR